MELTYQQLQKLYSENFSLGNINGNIQDKFIFGGRLAEYKYYDMDKIIEKCMNDYN